MENTFEVTDFQKKKINGKIPSLGRVRKTE